MSVNKYFTEGSIQQYSNICSDNGLAPARRQAIIWANVGMFHWRIHASLGQNELTNFVDRAAVCCGAAHCLAGYVCIWVLH